MLEYNNLKVLYIDDVVAVSHLYKNDIIDNLKYYEEEINEENIMLESNALINTLYDDFITLVNTWDYITDYDYILVTASLGLWYGRKPAKAKFKTLKDAIQAGSYDTNIIYFKNNNTTLTKESSHHDGSNSYKYYKVVKGKKYAIKYDEILNANI